MFSFSTFLVLLFDLKISYMFLFFTISTSSLQVKNEWLVCLVLFFLLNICCNFFQVLWWLYWPLFIVIIIITVSLYFTVTDQEKSLKELRKDDKFYIFPYVFPLLGFIYGFEWSGSSEPVDYLFWIMWKLVVFSLKKACTLHFFL